MTAYPQDAPQDGEEFARAAALVALAREVDGLRRRVDPLREVGGRVEDLALLVGQLADAVAAVSAHPPTAPVPSWLLLPTDEAVVERVLGELCGWMHAIYLRYPDGATVLPDCWLYHPDVVQELVWLMHAWSAAYQGRAASVQLAGDWHDRQRPGVVRRIRANAGSCSIERHITRPGWDQHPTGAVPVPGTGAVRDVIGWWAGHRDDPPPEPATPNQGFAANGVVHP